MPTAQFKFALQPLLRVRKLQEQDLQLRLAVIERERLQIENALRRQQHQLAEGKQSMRGSLVGHINTNNLRLYAASGMAVMRTAQRMVLELAGVHRRLEGARAELIHATQNRRAVELLRDRRYREWKRKIDQTEVRLLDDLAVNAAARTESARDSQHAQAIIKEMP